MTPLLFLPKELEDIMIDYKYQLHYTEKLNKCIEEILIKTKHKRKLLEIFHLNKDDLPSKFFSTSVIFISQIDNTDKIQISCSYKSIKTGRRFYADMRDIYLIKRFNNIMFARDMNDLDIQRHLYEQLEIIRKN